MTAPDPSECRFCLWWGIRWGNPGLTEQTRREAEAVYQHECKRHSPVLVPTMGNYSVGPTCWPRTQGTDFCGDFERYRGPDGNPGS